MKKLITTLFLSFVMFASHADDLKKDERDLNEVFTTTHACAAVVWNEKTKVLVKIKPCWNEEAYPSSYGDERATGIVVSKRGKQTCFRATGKFVIFTEVVETRPGQRGSKVKETPWRLSVPKPATYCYAASGK